MPRLRLSIEPLEDRLVLNNRFVVPLGNPIDNVTNFATLSAALTKTGLTPGDIVEIQPNSTPGSFVDANLPTVTNLTIRGHLGFNARDLPPIVAGDAIGIDGGQTGIRLENLNINLTNPLTFNVNGSLLACNVTYTGPSGINAITLNGTTAFTARGNTLTNITGTGTLILVNTAPGAQNIITANTFVSVPASQLLTYANSNTIFDRVEDNSFIGASGSSAAALVGIFNGVNGLTVQRNSFRDDDLADAAINVAYGVENLTIRDNAIDFPSLGSIMPLIDVSAGGTGLTTSLTIERNRLRSPVTGVRIVGSSSGTIRAKVEGNDFVQCSTGVFIGTAGVSLSNIDLGGGTQGSKGGNNFRGLVVTAPSNSIRTNAAAGNAAISAIGNLFATPNPESSVTDNNDNSSLADVVVTGSITGDAAFVQALYIKFLRRAGELNNPNDAGIWVSRLSNGFTRPQVADAVVRSPEALGYVVDDLYKSILGRVSDGGGRQSFVGFMNSGGGTIEQVQAMMFASAEYRLRFAGDVAYVASLYQGLLGRSATAVEINGWIVQLPTIGRQGVASGFLGSREFRVREVFNLYTFVLKRTPPPTGEEVNGHVNTGFDLLTLRSLFASTSEFQGVG